MPPRWSRQSAVHRDDELTAAPKVVDQYDSSHLPREGPLQAFWHGPPARRAVAAAAGLFVLAGLALLGVFTVSDFMGGDSPASGDPSGAASESEPGLTPTPSGDPPPDLEGVLANATSSGSGVP